MVGFDRVASYGPSHSEVMKSLKLLVVFFVDIIRKVGEGLL